MFSHAKQLDQYQQFHQYQNISKKKISAITLEPEKSFFAQQFPQSHLSVTKLTVHIGATL